MNTCLIDGNCYEEGEVNPENPLEVCDGTLNGWTGAATGSTVTGSVPTSTASASTPGRLFCCPIIVV